MGFRECWRFCNDLSQRIALPSSIVPLSFSFSLDYCYHLQLLTPCDVNSDNWSSYHEHNLKIERSNHSGREGSVASRKGMTSVTAVLQRNYSWFAWVTAQVMIPAWPQPNSKMHFQQCKGVKGNRTHDTNSDCLDSLARLRSAAKMCVPDVFINVFFCTAPHTDTNHVSFVTQCSAYFSSFFLYSVRINSVIAVVVIVIATAGIALSFVCDLQRRKQDLKMHQSIRHSVITWILHYCKIITHFISGIMTRKKRNTK